jgi:Tol biopolymer transport system component
MPDLRQRFRTLDRVPAPELWAEVTARAAREDVTAGPTVRVRAWQDAIGLGPRHPRRRLIGQLVLLLVTAALLLASLALIVGGPERAGGSSTLVFTVGGPLDEDGSMAGQVLAIDLRDRAPAAPPRLVHESYGQRIHVSPDGRYALFEGLELREGREGASAGLVLARTDGSSARRLRDPGRYELGREFESIWAPDSHAVAWLSWRDDPAGTSRPRLMIADVDGEEPTSIAVPRNEDPHLVWSPDSVHVAYVEWGCESTVRHLYVVDTVTGEKRELGDRLQLPSLPVWSHDGRRLAALVATGDPIPASRPDEDTEICASRTGPNALVVGDIETGMVTTLVTGVEAYSRAWSADDRRVMWTAPGSSGGVSVWSVPADGGKVEELAMDVDAGVWSPGTPGLAWTAWDGDPEETFSLWVVELPDGTPRRIAQDVGSSGPSIWPMWSPDGQRIAFFRDAPRSADGRQRGSIWIVRRDGTGERLLVEASSGVDLGGVDW